MATRSTSSKGGEKLRLADRHLGASTTAPASALHRLRGSRRTRWSPSTGGARPSGRFSALRLTFYDGDAFPDWRGHIFMGNLPATQFLGRFSVDGMEVEMEERLLDGEGWAHP